MSFLQKTLFSLRSIGGEKTHDVCGARPHDRSKRDIDPRACRDRRRVIAFSTDSSCPCPCPSLDRNASSLFFAVVTVHALQRLLLEIS